MCLTEVRRNQAWISSALRKLVQESGQIFAQWVFVQLAWLNVKTNRALGLRRRSEKKIARVGVFPEKVSLALHFSSLVDMFSQTEGVDCLSPSRSTCFPRPASVVNAHEYTSLPLKKPASFFQEEEKALVFRDITLKLPSSGKVLIDSVTGRATAGRVLALMGPSGGYERASVRKYMLQNVYILLRMKLAV